MKLRDIFIALIAVLVFGTSFVAVKLGVREIPPLLLASLRFFFAAVPAIFFVRRPEVPIRFVVSFGLTMGAFQFALLYSAIRLGMPAGLSSVVLQTQVCFTVLLAYICFGEKPLPLEIIGSLVALSLAGLTNRQSILLFGVATAKTIHDHSGWSLPFDPMQFMFKNNADYHDIHHQMIGIKNNFSQPFFVHWDSLLGTEMTREEMENRRRANRAKAKSS